MKLQVKNHYSSLRELDIINIHMPDELGYGGKLITSYAQVGGLPIGDLKSPYLNIEATDLDVFEVVSVYFFPKETKTLRTVYGIYPVDLPSHYIGVRINGINHLGGKVGIYGMGSSVMFTLDDKPIRQVSLPFGTSFHAAAREFSKATIPNTIVSPLPNVDRFMTGSICMGEIDSTVYDQGVTLDYTPEDMENIYISPKFIEDAVNIIWESKWNEEIYSPVTSVTTSLMVKSYIKKNKPKSVRGNVRPIAAWECDRCYDLYKRGFEDWKVYRSIVQELAIYDKAIELNLFRCPGYHGNVRSDLTNSFKYLCHNGFPSQPDRIFFLMSNFKEGNLYETPFVALEGVSINNVLNFGDLSVDGGFNLWNLPHDENLYRYMTKTGRVITKKREDLPKRFHLASD